MSSAISITAKNCCSMEKQRLMEELRKCDFCSTNWKEHHSCFRQAAKDSGRRSRVCVHT